MKTISVIIPSYNREAYIKDAVDSVVGQEMPHGYKLEIIVVDDSSTDNTQDILRTYGNKITTRTIPHTGNPAIVRNVGLSMANGELIAFQDSDDIWTNGKLLKQLKAFEDESIVLHYGQAEIMDGTGQTTKTNVVDPKIISTGEQFHNLIKNNVISTLTVMVRASVFDKVGRFNESDRLRGVEDYDLWLRIAASFPGGIKCDKDTLAYYRKHENNISTSNEYQALKQICQALSNLWKWKLSKENRNELEKQIEFAQHNLGILSAKEFGTPVISVVMGAYNADEFIKPAVDSILAQTFTNFELLIINDGSSDMTQEILESYSDRRLRIINQENHGLVYTLNKGFGMAIGEFVARMDADDISLPSRFEKQLQLITSNPKLGVVGSYFTYIDEDSSKTSITIAMPNKHKDLHRCFYVVNPFAHGSTLIRKNAWLEHGGYTDKYGPTEDYELWRRVVESWDLAVIPEVLYWYRLNSAGISNSKQTTQHKYAKMILEEEWAKQHFVRKGPREIIKDGNYYLELDSPYAQQVFEIYIDQNIIIKDRLYQEGHFKAGAEIDTALLCLIKKRYVKKFGKSIFKGFVKRLNSRSTK